MQTLRLTYRLDVRRIGVSGKRVGNTTPSSTTRERQQTIVHVRDISCACEQQQGTIPSMFAAYNVDYTVDISSSDRIAREHFRFIEHHLSLEASRNL